MCACVRACVCACVRVSVRMCVRACVRAYVCACVRLCVCKSGNEIDVYYREFKSQIICSERRKERFLALIYNSTGHIGLYQFMFGFRGGVRDVSVYGSVHATSLSFMLCFE